MKRQVVLIHGGDTYRNYKEYLQSLRTWSIESLESLRKNGWKDTLAKELGKNYDIVAPKMPNKGNAKYLEWKIWFEKIIPLLDRSVILVGHSLGGIFLAKYLEESKFPRKILGTFLIAAPYDDKGSPYSLADFRLPKTLNRLASQSEKLFLYHSKDDYVVPFSDVEKYKEKLPKAIVNIFEDRGHFNQEEFKELVREISKL